MAEKAATKTKTTKEKAPAKAKAPKTSKDPNVKIFKDFTISKKRSGRYEVIGSNGKNVNGPEKAKILVEADLVKAMKPKAKNEAKTEEAPAAE